jgi:lipoprotein-anchoring transpeptidase ErfK/SrfK
MKEINISSKQSRHSTTKKSKKRNSHKPVLFLLLLVIIFAVWYFSFIVNPTSNEQLSQNPSNATSKTSQTVVSKPFTANVCSSNIIRQNIIVSISQRHLWACSKNNQIYNTAVITGNMNIAADVTPVGTYEIYAKQTDRYLTGTDGVTSWHDYVYYWLPFIDNEYGVYGFHDATWRASTDFGNISPYSSLASHGCVELPLTAAAWIYNWAAIGTTVIIQA